MLVCVSHISNDESFTLKDALITQMSSDCKQNTILIVIDLFVLRNDGFQFFLLNEGFQFS